MTKKIKILQSLELNGFYKGKIVGGDVCSEFLSICSLIGNPTKHDVNKKIIWDIKAKEKCNLENSTFSQHKDYAYFHTDSQYRENPEKYFGICALTPATDNGGVNQIITLSQIISAILLMKDGKAFLDTLKRIFFPFYVPNEFRLNDENIILKPILTNDEFIRFRFDTILKGFEFTKENQERKNVLNYFKCIVDSINPVLNYKLKKNEYLIIDNHRVLHSRTSFEDDNRHLIRVRMN